MFGQKVNNFFTGVNKDINMQRLAGIGAVLQGQNASPYLGNINAMQEQNKQEAADEERRAKIMEAMQGLGIGGAKAAILGTMGPAQQSQYLLGEMQRREAAGRASAAAAAKQAEEQEALKKRAVLFSPVQTQQAVTQMGGNPADMAQGVNTAQQGVVTGNRIARPAEVMERVIAGGPEFFLNKGVMDAVGTYGKTFDAMSPQQSTNWSIQKLADGMTYYVDEAGVLPPRRVAPDLMVPEGSTEFGLKPVIGRDENGDPVLMQVAKDGTAIATELPEGITVDPIQNKMDLASASVAGKAQGEAKAALPAYVTQAETALGTINRALNDENLASYVGVVDGRKPRWLSQGREDFMTVMDQIRGQNFLQAYQSLKGGGQITEFEGQKAEQAIARLNTAQSEDAFRDALRDLEAIIKVGINNAYKEAGLKPPTAPDDDDDEYLRSLGFKIVGVE